MIVSISCRRHANRQGYRQQWDSHFVPTFVLTLYLIAIHHAAAIWIGTGSIPIADGSFRVVSRFVHDLKATHTPRR
jgi:hypothetical protein